MTYRHVAVALIAGFLLAPSPAAAQPVLFSEEDPSGCYAFEGTERLRGEIDFPDQVAPVWFFVCPFGERPVLEKPEPEPETPLRAVLEALAKRPDGEPSWWAGELATWSTETLNTRLCRAVTYVRSIAKFQDDPKPERKRTGREIQAWLLDLTGPGRPPEARRLRPFIESASPQFLKAAHDGAKAAWPAVARVACPELLP